MAEVGEAGGFRLEMRSISKSFGPIQALQDVSLGVAPGEVHALMGENGAGKSTLIKILAGAQVADAGGEIRIDGARVTVNTPQDARARGIAVIYQELALSPNLNVAENIFLGSERSRKGIVKREEQRRICEPVLERLGATFKPETLVQSLSLGQRQMVEIARALQSDANIIVMDEPTTSLSERECDHLFAIVEKLRAEGISIIYISHRMDEVYRLSDRVSVLRDGAYIGTLDRAELNPTKLVSMMVGREASGFYEKAHRAPADRKPLLEVRELASTDGIGPCSFDLCAGEVLGVAGLVGSGRTELARLIYGSDRASAGTVHLGGRQLDRRSPGASLSAGIAYLTEDRKGLGLFLEMNVSDNVALSVLKDRSGQLGAVVPSLTAGIGKRMIKMLDIRGARPGTRVGNLSGGNQQKALLGRLLEASPKVLILDEPTRGVDVGAKSEIYGLIDQLTSEGMAVMLISSELSEVIGTADRILVMREGKIAGEVANSKESPATQEAVMTLAAGARSDRGTSLLTHTQKEALS